MKNRFLNYTIAICTAFLLSNCEDIDTHKPFGSDSGHAPGIVNVMGYEQVPGGATIKFEAPKDEDLLYIKIKYTLDNGKEMTARASLYTNETTVEGFADTNPKTLEISAVNKMNKEGEVVTTEITPGKPAFITALEDIKVSPTFGGIYVATNNDSRNYLIFDVSTKDGNGQWVVNHTEYTTLKNVNFALRGFESEAQDFKVRVRDLFGNVSRDTVFTETPLYEEQLDRTKCKGLVLPTDYRMDNAGHNLDYLFNGDKGKDSWNYAHGYNVNLEEFPVWFTIDMGQKAQLSRYTIWERSMGGSLYYREGAIKTWEVWGCSDTPPQDGSWDGWVKLMDCESVKPSGYPVGQLSEEDINYQAKGEDFTFPDGIPPVRYLRFKILTTWDGMGLVVMQQMWFYGTPIK